MKGSSVLTVTTTVMVILLVLDATLTHASPMNRGWDNDAIDDNLAQKVANNLLNQMTEFERIRRTGLSARQGALSNYLKAKELSARINNPYGPGRRK